MTLSTLTYPAFLRNRRRTSSRPPAGKYNKKIGRLVDGYPLHSTFLKASDCKSKCEKNEEQENHGPIFHTSLKISVFGQNASMSSDGICVILSLSTIDLNKYLFKQKQR